MVTQNRDRSYEVIKDKYFLVFVPAPVMNASVIFDTLEEAKQHLLEITGRPANDLEAYTQIEKDVTDSGGALMILNIEKEVERYEKEHQYGGENFKDRQHFINVIVFGDPEEC